MISESDIRIPAPEYFSDPELRSLFLREFLFLCLVFQSTLDKSNEAYEDVRVHFTIALGLRSRAIKDLPSPNQLDLNWVHNLNVQWGWNTFCEVGRIPLHSCELCGRRLRAVQKAHIITRRYFRSLDPEARRVWQLYENSPTNILRLCGHCHDVVDKPSLTIPRRQLRRLISKRRRANKRLIRLLKRDVRKLDIYTKQLKKFLDKEKSGRRQDFNRFMFNCLVAGLLHKKSLWGPDDTKVEVLREKYSLYHSIVRRY